MLFNRVATIEIGEPGSEGIKIENLRIVFRVEKSSSKTLNKCTADIYNLSKETRDRIVPATSGKKIITILKAGYSEDQPPRTIFIGEISRVTHYSEPPNRYTRIECNTGSDVVRNIKTSLSYAPGAGALQILNDIAGQLNLDSSLISSDLTDSQYVQGYQFVGPITNALDEIVKRLDAKWSIQDDGLQVTPKHKPTPNDVIVISPESGLIGIPERNDASGGDVAQAASGVSGWNVSSLMIPGLIPGSNVKLESESIEGIFLLEAVVHDGDTHGGDWKSSLTLEEIPE